MMDGSIRTALILTAEKFDRGEFRWAQGDREGEVPRGCDCAVSGLRRVTLGMTFTWQDEFEAKRRLASVISPNGGAVDIVAWNDAPGRTVDEVVAAFRKAAA